MANGHGATLTIATLSSPDPPALARFYARLLGWEIGTEEPGWVTLRNPERRNWPRLPHRGRLHAAGLALQARRADHDDAPRDSGGRPGGRMRPRAGMWGDDGRIPAAGRCTRPPRPGRPPVLPLPRRLAGWLPHRRGAADGDWTGKRPDGIDRNGELHPNGTRYAKAFRLLPVGLRPQTSLCPPSCPPKCTGTMAYRG